MNLYYIRHAEPDYSIKGDYVRPLTSKGLSDRYLLIELFSQIKIDMIYSSPYKRASDTLIPLAQEHHLPILINYNLRERKSASHYVPDSIFHNYALHQWNNHDYKLPGGESLNDVKKRMATELNYILITGYEHNSSNIIVGTHITALCALISYYLPSFRFPDFDRVRGKKPWVVKFSFINFVCKSIESIDVFSGNCDSLYVNAEV